MCVDDTIVRNDNGGKNAISVDVKLVPITVTVSALLSMGEHGRFGEKAHDAESGVVGGGLRRAHQPKGVQGRNRVGMDTEILVGNCFLRKTAGGDMTRKGDPLLSICANLLIISDDF